MSSDAASHRILDGCADDLPASTDRDTARRYLGPQNAAEAEAHRTRILELIDEHPLIADRQTRPGHLTGSAFVVDPHRGAAVLLFHTKLQRWLQPGGHADGDTNLARVALREAEEETGIVGLRVVTPAIDIDIHEVDPPKEDAHLHLDVRFLVLAPPQSSLSPNHESQDIRWVTPADLSSFDVDPGLVRMATIGYKVADALADQWLTADVTRSDTSSPTD